ncbi:MAG: response regulator receiver modulated diguanylate cyclase [Ilumatobacteraceae bacterium]|nr:response regulator receiver modulated diguanylate cyclase [Ilumatobacteraceae bacterium]MCU1388557.1 response regulator receiver modulated diguanylate cyclase [Ilumatobacteraceae bacterium]
MTAADAHGAGGAGRILVAEDSLVIRAVVRDQLEEEGYQVCEAVDGEDALVQAAAERPDAILLDIEMPGLDGHQVLARLKADPTLADTPVVFLTGRTSTADMVDGLRAGAHDYLKKPFEPAELLARVGGAVRIKRLQDQLRDRNEQLDKLSRIDALTGIYNRRHIDEQLANEASRAQRHNQTLAVLMLDIDHFKHVNDTEGHPAGDEVLREFAARLRTVLRTDDVIGRWGGEEFVILAPQTDLAGALTLAERARKAIADRPVEFGELSISITVSIGCTIGLDGASALIGRADKALYLAKNGGRNRVISA